MIRCRFQRDEASDIDTRWAYRCDRCGLVVRVSAARDPSRIVSECGNWDVTPQPPNAPGTRIELPDDAYFRLGLAIDDNRREGRVEVPDAEIRRRLDVCRACPVGYFTPAGCTRWGSRCKQFDQWVYKLGRKHGCDQHEKGD